MKTTKKTNDKPLQTVTPTEFSNFDLLDANDQELVYLRIEGFEPRHITSFILQKRKQTVAEGTVRNWFASGGRLYAAWQEKEAEKKKILEGRKDEIYSLLALAVKDAFLTLLNSTRKGSIQAAMNIMEMAGFKAILKIEDGRGMMFEAPKDEKEAELQVQVLTKLHDYIRTNQTVLADEDRNVKS